MIQETSREAYRSIEPFVESALTRVFNLIAANIGIINEQIEIQLGMKGNTVRPRVRELVEAKRVAASGEFGLTESGRRAIKWIALAA